MATIKELQSGVVAKLREAGYAFVEAASPRGGRQSAEVVAWASDDEGNSVPLVTVLVKTAGIPEPSLAQLGRRRDELGTAEHYVVVAGDWFRADDALGSLHRVAGPTPTNLPPGRITEEGSAKKILQKEAAVNALRRGPLGEPGLKETLLGLPVTVGEAGVPGITTSDGVFVEVDRAALWKAVRSVGQDFSQRAGRRGAEHTTPHVTVEAMAELLGQKLKGRVLDPFCGSGGNLWSAVDRAVAEGTDVEVVGQDLMAEGVEVARFFGALAPIDSTVSQGDAFNTPFEAFDAVVSAPPFGMKLLEPWTLLDGSITRESDAAAVDLCVRALNDGGRAVLQVAPRFVQSERLRKYRDFLANNFRVGALIGCPSGSATGTVIRTVLLVIDKSAPTSTFVAHLGEDWETQLAQGGPALVEALEWLDAENGSSL